MSSIDSIDRLVSDIWGEVDIGSVVDDVVRARPELVVQRCLEQCGIDFSLHQITALVEIEASEPAAIALPESLPAVVAERYMRRRGAEVMTVNTSSGPRLVQYDLLKRTIDRLKERFQADANQAIKGISGLESIPTILSYTTFEGAWNGGTKPP